MTQEELPVSERKKPHNGRDKSGHFKVKQVDVDDLQTDADGSTFVRDDVRLGGAVADTGPTAGQLGEHIGELVTSNREDVDRVTGRPRRNAKRSR
jgi:hypothetical protein